MPGIRSSSGTRRDARNRQTEADEPGRVNFPDGDRPVHHYGPAGLPDRESNVFVVRARAAHGILTRS